MKEEIATVSATECTNLLKIFKHKQVLKRLKTIKENKGEETNDSWTDDYKMTCDKIDDWWREISRKYNFKNEIGAKWTIDFQTRKIYLITQ